MQIWAYQESAAEKKLRALLDKTREKEQAKIAGSKLKQASVTIGKVEPGIAQFSEVLNRPGIEAIPSAVLNPLRDALSRLESYRDVAQALMSNGGVGDALPTNPQISSAIMTGKRAVQLIVNMLAAVAKAMQ